MIAEIVQAIGTAMTTFVPQVGKTLTTAFSSLFWEAGTGDAAGQLTLLAQGLLALAGIGLVIGCVMKVYHILSGRVRSYM